MSEAKTIHSLKELHRLMGSRSAKLGCYCVSNDGEGEYALVLAYGADDALDVLDENHVFWGGKGVSVNHVQRNVIGEREIIWIGKRAQR